MKKNKVVWDLTPLYQSINDPKIDSDLAQLKKDVVAFEKKHSGKVKSYKASEILTLKEIIK